MFTERQTLSTFQTIFVSLQKEIEKLNKEISELKKIKEVTAY